MEEDKVAELGEKLMDLLESYKDEVSIAETIGILEVAKASIINAIQFGDK